MSSTGFGRLAADFVREMPEQFIEIAPLSAPVRAAVELPGSKSLTNRALVLGALADGETVLDGALESDDTQTMVDALARLGFFVHWDRTARSIRIGGRRGAVPAREAELYGGNAGTTVRFLTSLVALGRGRFRIDGDQRMRERPIGDLLRALGAIGVSARSELGNDCPPVVVDAGGIAGGVTTVSGDTSSQFTSSILLAAPYARKDVRLRITGGLVGAPFVTMTLRMMGLFGVETERAADEVTIRSGQFYRARSMAIEPDATAASYFLAAPLLVGGELTVRGLDRDSLQGDVAFADVLSRMGAEVDVAADGVTVRARELRGGDYDFRDISDTFLTAAVLAPFASSPTRLRGLGHTRHQESDRVAAVARELARLGARVVEHHDALEIHPSPLHGGDVEPYDDHRIAMSFALIGLRVPGIRIRNPGCVAKTFPGYFIALEGLRSR